MKQTKLIIPLLLIIIALLTILVACGEGGSYSVRYVVDGAVEKSATIEKSAIDGFYTPEREGYTFDGWYLDKGFTTKFDQNSELKTNVVLYAKFSKKSFKVEFVANGNIVSTETVLYGEGATAPNPPTIQSKTFVKWDKDFSKVTMDMQVNAVYADQEKYTATFLLNGTAVYTHQFVGGEKTATSQNNALKKLDVPDGFTFIKWATLLNKDVPEVFPERNVEYKAVLAISPIEATLNAPFEGGAIDYTENGLNLSVNHKKYTGISYNYSWYLDGSAVADTKSFSLPCPNTGNHTVKTVVYASSQWAESISETLTYNFVVNTATLSSIATTEVTVEYDGKPHNIKVDTLAGDTVEYSTDRTHWTGDLSFVNAGEYSIYVRLTRANYYPYETKTPTKLTIEKHVVKGTIKTETISYGDTLPSTYKINYTGFIGTDNQSVFSGSIAFTTTAQNSRVIGTYAVSGDTSGYLADNYTLDLQDGTLEITKRVLRVTADSKTINFGDALPELTITYVGFAPGENVSNLDKAPTIFCSYTAGNMAGKYSITVSGAESEHYHFVYKDGTLTVS